MQVKILRVRNFDRFQHYKSRDITKWVKIHFHELFDNDFFWSLCNNERWIFIGLILWAGKTKNEIPYKPAFLSEKICHDNDRGGFKAILEKFIDGKFLIVETIEVAKPKPEPQKKARENQEPKATPSEPKKESVKMKPPTATPPANPTDTANLTEIQKVVLLYKESKEIDINDKNWDSAHFKRASASAKKLLEIFENDLKIISDYIVDSAKYYEVNNLSWTSETLVKNAHDWIVRQKRRDEK